MSDFMKDKLDTLQADKDEVVSGMKKMNFAAKWLLYPCMALNIAMMLFVFSHPQLGVKYPNLLFQSQVNVLVSLGAIFLNGKFVQWYQEKLDELEEELTYARSRLKDK